MFARYLSRRLPRFLWVTLAVAGVFVLFAARAHATLLVRADGNGLFVQDKNGLNDDVFLVWSGSELDSGQNVYWIENRNVGDVFKFDIQFGCSQHPDFQNTALCHRNGPNFAVALGNGNDRLAAGAAPVGSSTVTGGQGNDTLFGHRGADTLNGNTGDDDLRAADGDDTLDGGDGADRLIASDGNDTLRGGDGSDSLFGGTGDDVLRGGADNDFIQSKEPDGVTSIDDGVECGTGLDTVEADLRDTIFSNCEDVDRSPVGETNVHILGRTLRVARDGRVKIRLRCPREVGALGCNGRLRLRLDRRQSGSSGSRAARYRIKAGQRKTVGLRLTVADVQTIARRRLTRGVLTSVERGIKGPKTTIRNLRLRLR